MSTMRWCRREQAGKCSSRLCRISRCIAFILGLALSPARAQTIDASLSGTITDPAGASVPAAKVQIVNTGTNAAVAVFSNSDGSYDAPALPAGTYDVTVSANGFKTDRRTGVTLDVSQSARLDLHLELGSMTETVDVTATAPLLDTTTSSVGQVVDSTSIANLPLNQRNPFSLVFLAPGVTGTVSLLFNQGNISANGGRPGTEDVLIDGTPSAPPGAVPINVIGIFPSVDALQEFRVQTSNYAPEYGRSGSGIINMIFKSGTNQFHGTAFELLRNSVMDSNSFFSNRAGIPLASFKRSQFGFTLGGPVMIPKLFNGHDKMFFFGDYEGLRQRQATSTTGTVPTLLQRTGDFSQTFAQNGQKIIIYDPLTTTPSGPTYSRSPFPGNAIPANRIDRVAGNVMKYYPLPNQPGNPITNTNNYYAAGETPLNIDQWDVKVDENLNDDNRFFVRVSRRDYENPHPVGLFPAAINVAETDTSTQVLGSGASFDYTRTDSPSFVSEVRVGFSRDLFSQVPIGYGFNTDQLGFPSYIHAMWRYPTFPRLLRRAS
ncbi:MAG: carboxypeptidase regulatory-like domain-containing protein [Acidobacteriaceae bacterium]|nr:carboxypeptidase regulatory-like domain-containing protein [Acidobacteriaceae bacterium]